MATKETLLKELDWVTEKISSQVWTLNLGTLGTTWSLLITAAVPDKLKLTIADARWIFGLSLVALLCEMGQYLSSYRMYRSVLRELERAGAAEFQYDTGSIAYRLRIVFFYFKIALTISAAVLLLVTIFGRLG